MSLYRIQKSFLLLFIVLSALFGYGQSQDVASCAVSQRICFQWCGGENRSNFTCVISNDISTNCVCIKEINQTYNQWPNLADNNYSQEINQNPQSYSVFYSPKNIDYNYQLETRQKNQNENQNKQSNGDLQQKIDYVENLNEYLNYRNDYQIQNEQEYQNVETNTSNNLDSQKNYLESIIASLSNYSSKVSSDSNTEFEIFTQPESENIQKEGISQFGVESTFIQPKLPQLRVSTELPDESNNQIQLPTEYYLQSQPYQQQKYDTYQQQKSDIQQSTIILSDYNDNFADFKSADQLEDVVASKYSTIYFPAAKAAYTYPADSISPPPPPSPPPPSFSFTTSPCQGLEVQRCRLPNCTIIEFKGQTNFNGNFNSNKELSKIVLFDVPKNDTIHCYEACMGMGCMGFWNLPAQAQTVNINALQNGYESQQLKKPLHPMCESVGQTIWSIEACCQEYEAFAGENLCDIANKFEISCEALKVLNGLEFQDEQLQLQQQQQYQQLILDSDYTLQIC